MAHGDEKFLAHVMDQGDLIGHGDFEAHIYCSVCGLVAKSVFCL
jgi:hypothetical protein